MNEPSDKPSEEKQDETAVETTSKVRGSIGHGGGGAQAQSRAEGFSVGRHRSMPEPVYKPQACRLCARDTIYLTRSGLSDHATVHHGCWYSAKRDEHMRIPEEELAVKCRRVKDGQQHRKH